MTLGLGQGMTACILGIIASCIMIKVDGVISARPRAHNEPRLSFTISMGGAMTAVVSGEL